VARFWGVSGCGDVVSEIQYQTITGIQPQRGRLNRNTVIHINVAIVREARAPDFTPQVEIQREGSILAVEIQRIGDWSSRGRTGRAHLRRRTQRETANQKENKPEPTEHTIHLSMIHETFYDAGDFSQPFVNL
jgi:hypothetical protein